MQIPKISLFICTLAVSGGLALHAQDNPAQAAARAALLDKMNELEAAPAVATPAPAPTAPAVPPAEVAPAAPETVTPPAAAAPVVEVTPNGATAPDAAQVEAEAKAKAEAKLEAQKEEDAKQASVLAEQKRAAEAAKKQAVLEAKERAANEKSHVVTPVNEPAKELGLAQVNAPALPIPATKQEKLASLLQLYKADQLSPEEYQTRRAAIIAEP